VISDGILLITAYKQNTGEERNKSAMKTLSLSLSESTSLSLSLSLSETRLVKGFLRLLLEIFFNRIWKFSSTDFGKKQLLKFL
jgi:hypothetical protein